MKKILTKLFILFSLLFTITSNTIPLTLDTTETNNIKIYSNYPLDDEKRG